MNEQIKQLMSTTLDKHFSYTWSTMDYDDISKFAEKFAELVVKDTMQVVANNLAPNTYLDVANAVINHYGRGE